MRRARRVQRSRYLGANRQCLFGLDPFFRDGPPQRIPLNELLRDEVRSAGLSNFINGNDIRMVQLRCRARASCWSRNTCSASFPNAGFSSFSATSRANWVSRASQTSPIPPAPRRLNIS
jgi:hypothetical protein